MLQHSRPRLLLTVRRSRCCTVTLLVATAIVWLASAALLAADPRPNVVVIVADDLGFADIGVHGCKDIPTPNIDSLAAHGVRCTNGYVSGPYCSPTRAGLLTGRYQQRFGHEFNPGPATEANIESGLSLDETTLPQRLRDAGYATGMVGKWHLGHAPQFHPQERGFESFFGFLGGAHQYVRWDIPQDPILRGREPAQGTDYLTDAFGKEAVAFIKTKRDKPFFLYLPFNAVHGPLQATEKYKARFPDIADDKRRTYAAMNSAMDDAIGGVLAALRETGVEENTLIFFISDNGGPEGVNASDNGPLRGVKATTWEGGVHVPFLVQWKAKLPQGTTYDAPVIQLDIFPTVLAAAGVSTPNPKPFDGVNLLPFLHGEQKEHAVPHETLYWRFGNQLAIRQGDWKLVKARADGERPLGNRREKADPAGAMLFNLKDDLGEQTDLASAQPEKVKALTAAWQAWNAELVDATWGPPARQRQRAAATD